MPAPVPAEDELVHIGLDVVTAEAVIDAQRQALEVREHPVNPGQQDMARDRADNLGPMLPSFWIAVGRQPS